MWEIYAYQNADSLFGIFNAAAAIFASSDYAAALAAVAFFGFAAALVAYAFAPEKLQGWKWLASVVLVFAVLIVPRVTVGIVDKTGGSPVKTVDNVPFGVALLGSVTSTIGHTLTGLFETAFQTIPGAGALPSELAYQQNGLMFGNRLIRETGKVVFPDPSFRTDLINFIHNCTTYDLIDGTIDPAAFAAADDVWPLMATPNPARFSTVTGAGGLVGIDTCTNVYLDLNGRLPAQIERIQGSIAFQMNPTLPGAAASAVIASQIQQAYLKNGIANASASAADIIRQNAMLNAIEDTSKIAGQKSNDPAAMVLAVGRAQAVAQQNAAWLNFGKVAEQALPVLRNVIEAVTYAIFPLFVLLMLLTSGRETMMAFKGYATILIWIQLWPPLYAIMNYMAATYAAYDLAAAADLGTGTKALALQTASSIYSRAISGEAIVGYLAISIPLIAWMALKRMEYLGSAMIGGLSGLQATLSGATASAAAGNVSMGNVGMDQMRLAPNRTSAFMGSLQNDLSGDTFSTNALTGRTAASLLRNQGFASRVVSMRVSEQDVQQASRQVDTARGEAVAAARDRSAVLGEAFTKGMSKLHSTRASDGQTSSGFEQWGETLQQVDQITKNLAANTGLSQSQVANIALGASGYAGVRGRFAGAHVSASANKSYLSSLTAQEQQVLGNLNSEQLATLKQFGDRVSRDASFMRMAADDEREAQDMAARLASTTSRSERAQASLTERSSFAERISSAHERGEAISIDIAQDPHNLEMFMRYARDYGGNSAAAHSLMDSELARQALTPHRASDGSALPMSFGELRERHARQGQDIELSPDIQGQHQTNRRTVSGSGMSAREAAPSPLAASSMRDEIRDRGAEIRAQVDSRQQDFDRKSEIVETGDGTLATQKSLLWQSAKQAKEDAVATAGNAKDLVKDLMK
ncbi:MAG: conjugal transfer protein TraG N-terminal domain-containing protein [Azoarcus sp.]|jgi:conjugal transfer mating pair stabilization protein TraG|nr:conjugal transfer protein TraG N-terminal domain-containing protein [Azoarcus sp.]